MVECKQTDAKSVCTLLFGLGLHIFPH